MAGARLEDDAGGGTCVYVSLVTVLLLLQERSTDASECNSSILCMITLVIYIQKDVTHTFHIG